MENRQIELTFKCLLVGLQQIGKKAEESFGVEVSETREKKEVLQRVSRSKDGSGLTVRSWELDWGG